jgi:hypothetical protein
MTDRELLELAAKAAGIALSPMEVKNVSWQGDDSFIGYMTVDHEQWPRGWFDPLTIDGDAFRLAVKLGIDLQIYNGVKATTATDRTSFKEHRQEHDNDPYAATRRAIVLAAAEIGKARHG